MKVTESAAVLSAIEELMAQLIAIKLTVRTLETSCLAFQVRPVFSIINAQMAFDFLLSDRVQIRKHKP